MTLDADPTRPEVSMNNRKRHPRAGREKRNVTRRILRQELLESRHLLALVVAFDNGVLEIVSDDHDDILVSSQNGYVMINGMHPMKGCRIAGSIREVHANGGILSHVDLSGVRNDRESFSQLEVTTESQPSEQWLRDVAGIEKSTFDQLQASIYSDRTALTQGVTWSVKVDQIDQILRTGGVTAKQVKWIQDVDFFPVGKMAYYDALQFDDANSDDPALPFDQSLSEGEDEADDKVAIMSPGGYLFPPYITTNIGEQDGYAYVYIRAPQPEGGMNPFSVDYATNDLPPSEYAAIETLDYQETSGTLSFADGDEGEVRIVSIPIVDDIIDEHVQDFEFKLSNVVNMDGDESDVGLGNSELTIRIIDSDALPAASIMSDTADGAGMGSDSGFGVDGEME